MSNYISKQMKEELYGRKYAISILNILNEAIDSDEPQELTSLRNILKLGDKPSLSWPNIKDRLNKKHKISIHDQTLGSLLNIFSKKKVISKIPFRGKNNKIQNYYSLKNKFSQKLPIDSGILMHDLFQFFKLYKSGSKNFKYHPDICCLTSNTQIPVCDELSDLINLLKNSNNDEEILVIKFKKNKKI